MMSPTDGKHCVNTHTHTRFNHRHHRSEEDSRLWDGRQVYLLGFESGSQQELLVLLSDLDVVDFVLVEDHEGEGLAGQLPGAVPHKVRPVLNAHTKTHGIGRHAKPDGKPPVTTEAA